MSGNGSRTALDFHDIGVLRPDHQGAVILRSIALPFPLAALRPMLEPNDGPEPFAPAVAAALALHVGLAILVFLLPAARPLRPPRENTLNAQILTSEEFAAANARRPAAEEPAAGVPPRPPSGEPMTQATHFFSGGLLADPRSRKAREALPGLAPDERIIQLCNIEALEQIHTANAARFQPDFAVAYAMAEVKLAGDTMEANGGAFRSRGRWYRLSYRCAVAPGLTQVVSFAYRVGDPIPKEDWASHGLIAGDGPGD